MRKRSIDRILRDAVIADAEAQGRQLFPEFEEIPEASQARFDAALYGRARTEKEPQPEPTPAPQRYSTRPQGVFGRILSIGLGAAAVAAILFVIFGIGIFGGAKGGVKGEIAEQPPYMAEATPQPCGAPPEAQPTSEPEMTAEPTGEPEPTNAPEQGEPLPYASATFADESEAVARMKHFYEENRTLLMQVAEDMKAPEHGYIDNGVVYPVDGSRVLWDKPYTSMTNSIRAFLDLPDSGDYILSWNEESDFFVSLLWTNDSGYYSTELVYAEDGQKIVKMMSEEHGSVLEPVYEDGAWGVYTVCWQKAPYWCDSSYAPKRTVGVWGTDDDLLYLELSDDGTARIADLFGEHDIRAHFAWRYGYDRDYIRITFSDQTVVKTALLNTDTDAMTLTLADGGTAEATRAEGGMPPESQPTDETEEEPEQPSEWPESIVDTWVIWEKIEANGETIEMDGRFDEMSLVFDANGKVTVTVYDQIEVVDYSVRGNSVAFTFAGESVFGQADLSYKRLTFELPGTGETLVFQRELWAEGTFEVSGYSTYKPDNGLSGIGNLRGNTNGNLSNGGRAVSDGKHIYYIDQTVDYLRICSYTFATGETAVLTEAKDVDRRAVGYLNYANGHPNLGDPYLYYVIDDWYLEARSRDRSDLMRLSLTDGTTKKIASDKTAIGFFDVYEWLYYVTDGSTKELAANGMELDEIEDFRMIGAMGALLYGIRGDRIVSIERNTHEPVQSYDLSGDVVVSSGYLIGCELAADNTSVLTVVNVETGEIVTINTGLSYAAVVNVGKDWIYLEENGYLSDGGIYRIRFDGTDAELVRPEHFGTAPSLWWDTFLVDFVPCDEMAGATDEG